MPGPASRNRHTGISREGSQNRYAGTGRAFHRISMRHRQGASQDYHAGADRFQSYFERIKQTTFQSFHNIHIKKDSSYIMNRRIVKHFSALLLTVTMAFSSVPAVNGKELPAVSENTIVDSFSTTIQHNAYVLYEMGSDCVIAESNSNEKFAPASITKIMTLILIYDALANGSISNTVTVTVSDHAASMGGSQIFLEPGEELSVSDMIKSIVIASANDACVAMAEHVGGTEENFVSMMNEKAQELGMNNTHFVNACGLDAEDHYSSALDIAIMSDYLLENYPEVTEYTLTWMDSITHNTAKGSTEFGLTNTNKLVRTFDGITGLKTGSTGNAGYSVSASATRGDTSYVAVVLGADTTQNRFKLAADLLNFGFASYKAYKPAEEKMTYDAGFRRSKKNSYTLYGDCNDSVLVSKDFDESKVTYEYVIDEVSLPVKEGERCGTVILYYDGQELCEYPLLASEDILEVSYTDYLERLIRNF